jgi:hypothetical protein
MVSYNGESNQPLQENVPSGASPPLNLLWWRISPERSREAIPMTALGAYRFPSWISSNLVGLPNGCSIPASRSSSALRTCSLVKPLGIDWGMGLF